MRAVKRKIIIDLLWTLLFAALATGVLLVLPALSWGDQAHVPLAQPVPPTRPHPAWRYERATGPRAAVVRIYSQDGPRMRSIGSGTLVRWNGRIVVLTARHVVQDARRIIVELCTKRTLWARIVKVDAVWDCAVLELIGEPAGVEPAEVALGKNAKFSKGDRLESCGYGADGKLACNSGLFIGYRRAGIRATVDDWMEISGHARQGDSGGGVFNTRGRLVGVLWGTDGKTVVCVQPGRIHLLLNQAVPRRVDQKALVLAAIYRNPTPPQEPRIIPQRPLAPVPPRSCPTGQACDETAYGKPKPILGWRDGAQKRDNDLERRQRALLQALEAERRARLASPPEVFVARPPATQEAAPDAEPSPLLAGLGIVAGVVVGFVIYFAMRK